MEARHRKKDEIGMRRRGISIKSGSEDEDIENNGSVLLQGKKKPVTAEERMRRLAEFRQNKEMKKTADKEAKMKRPPWKPGGVYKDVLNHQTCKISWNKTSLKSNEVFVFKAGKIFVTKQG